MSMDLLRDSTSRRHIAFQRAEVEAAVRGRVASPVTDIIIVFGGWGSAQAGQPLPAGGASDTQRLIARLQELRAATGRTVLLRSYQGSLTEDNPGEREAVRLITQQFHPLGKLIFYGYSAGGFSVLRLCYRFGMMFQFYDVGSRQIMPYPPYQNGRREGDVYGFVRVDRLITIDAAAGPMSGLVRRRAWPSVRRCLNIYQTERSPVWSHGGPVEAFDPSVTEVVNHDWTSRFSAAPAEGHGQIDRESFDLAFETIRSELTS